MPNLHNILTRGAFSSKEGVTQTALARSSWLSVGWWISHTASHHTLQSQCNGLSAKGESLYLSACICLLILMPVPVNSCKGVDMVEKSPSAHVHISHTNKSRLCPVFRHLPFHSASVKKCIINYTIFASVFQHLSRSLV